jgi:hypothetical protein
MAENIVIYAGIDKVGKRKKIAIEREAKRLIKDGSVSALFWEMFSTHGSVKLKKDLQAAELSSK